MNIEAELKKDGIEVVEKLDMQTVSNIANKVSNMLYNTFPNYGFGENELYERLSQLDMYKAKMPERNE